MADVQELLNDLQVVLSNKIIQRNRLTEMLGVSPSTMSRWLNGQVVPRGLSVHQLRRVLNEINAPKLKGRIHHG